MLLQQLGTITLNISVLLYLVWYVPQLAHTFKRHTTRGLSFTMHSLLSLGYISDFVYGFGRHLPWQYKLVTLFGLIALTIEHIQFWRYDFSHSKEKIAFACSSLFFILLSLTALYHTFVIQHSTVFYNAIGGVSLFCWLAFMWPQVWKNYQLQSTRGFSEMSVTISLISGVADSISAYALGWDWPSKVGALLGLIPKCLLLLQYYIYRKPVIEPLHA